MIDNSDFVISCVNRDFDGTMKPLNTQKNREDSHKPISKINSLYLQ